MDSRQELAPGIISGEWWHQLPDGRFQCDLCPRNCQLRTGQRGFCTIRQAYEDGISLASYGRASGFAIDPIEKKPLNHFYPGSRIYSFGTAGCNLGCQFCQNWHISKARQDDKLGAWASPDEVARAAKKKGCNSIAFTYNDPVIFAEYAIDCAIAAHEVGLKTVAVTAGYITPLARQSFFEHIDAANVDLKSFSAEFYRRICYAELAPVLDTLLWLRRETDVWLEVTTLLIPGKNDSPAEIEALCKWFVNNLGADVPLHFTAFHPHFKMKDVPPTPPVTLHRARQKAMSLGLRHVYTGNVFDPQGQSTYCPYCGELLIAREGYHVRLAGLKSGGVCQNCGELLAGRFR